MTEKYPERCFSSRSADVNYFLKTGTLQKCNIPRQQTLGSKFGPKIPAIERQLTALC